MENRNACLAKTTLLVLLLLMWASAGAFIFVGAYALHVGGDFNHVATNSHVFIPAVVSLSLGVAIFVIALIGCFACTLDNKVMLAIFFALLTIVFMGQISCLICGVVYRSRLEDSLTDVLKKELNDYLDDPPIRNELDFIQEHFECCGVNNYTDWYQTKYYQQNGTLPNSCCHGGICVKAALPPQVIPSSLDHIPLNHTEGIWSNFEHSLQKGINYYKELFWEKDSIQSLSTIRSYLASDLQTTAENNHDIFDKGCFGKLEDVIRSNFGWITAIAVFFLIIHLTGIISTLVILCRSDSEVRYEQFGIISDGLTV
jgi:hypothetical protein